MSTSGSVLVRASARVSAELGLHARPCAAIAQYVGRSGCAATLTWDGTQADAGSVIDLLTLGVPTGEAVELVVEGPDAADTLAGLVALIEAVV